MDLLLELLVVVIGTDPCIVVGNTQTLYRNIDRIRKMFGTIILDEMHHVSSPTFRKSSWTQTTQDTKSD